MKGRRSRSRIGVNLITLSPCFSFSFLATLGSTQWLTRSLGFLLGGCYTSFTITKMFIANFGHDQFLRGLITVTVTPSAAKILARNLRIVRYLAVSGRKGRKNVPLPHASLVDRVIGCENV